MRLPRVFVWLLVLVSAGCAAPGSSGNSRRNVESPDAIAAANQVQMGRAYLQRGQREVALERLTKALQLDPRSTDAHTVIAVLFEEIERPERAETHYKRAVELDPDAGAVNNNYGQFLCRTGRYEEAEARFVKAMDDPFYATPALVLNNAGICALRAGHRERAEEYLRKALRLDPRSPGILLDLARLRMEGGEWLSARGFLQRHEAVSPPRPDALELGIAIETGLGDTAAAERYRERFRSEFPDHESAPKLQGEPASQ